MAAPFGQLYDLVGPDDIDPTTWLASYESTVLVEDCYVELWTGMSPDEAGDFDNYKYAGPLRVTGGTVTIDRNNAVRRSASNITLNPDDNIEFITSAVGAGVDNFFGYAPYGQELRLFKGVCSETLIPGDCARTAGVYAPSLSYTIVEGVNDQIVFHNLATGVTYTFIVPPGTYDGDACTIWRVDVIDPSHDSVHDVTIGADGPTDGMYWFNACGVGGGFFDAWYTGVAINGSTFTGSAMMTLFGVSTLTMTGGTDDTYETECHYASLGVFMIEEVDVVNDATGVTLVGTLKDRGQWVTRRTLQAPLGIVGGDVYYAEDAIGIILLACANTLYLPFNFYYDPSCMYVNALSYAIGADPWSACQDIATAAGMQLYFDYNGDLQLRFIPNASGLLNPCTTDSNAYPSPVVAYIEGTEIAPVSIKRNLSNLDIPNVVCVQSQGSGVATPYQCFWWQDDNGAPTYYAPTPSLGFLTPQPVVPPLAAGSKYPTNMSTITTSVISDPLGFRAQFAALMAGLLAGSSVERTMIVLRDQPAHDIDDVVSLQRIVAGLDAPQFEGPPDSVDCVVDLVQIDLGVTKGTQLTVRIIGQTEE